MPALFNDRIVAAAIDGLTPASPTQIDAAAQWAARARSDALDLQNESQIEQDFNRVVIRDLLGYRTQEPGAPGTFGVKQSIPGGTIVDAALGHFDGAVSRIVAPLELKGPKVALDRIMPGRAKTPVQQAWDYAMDAPGARWVLLSNMKELRLYAFGHGRQAYEPFDLKRIDEPAELDRLRLLLGADRLLGEATKALLDRSAEADRAITNQLYRDYKNLRAGLGTLIAAQHPGIGVEDRIRIIQTLLDRVLFIAFAEDKGLLPPHSLADAATGGDIYFPRPKWERLCKLFEWIDKGDLPRIPSYNGGLFRRDELIDGLALPDHLVEQFAVIADYDFASEVSVTILGHIFEQSITDIENEKAAAGIEAPPPAPKKKREGVVYTPDFITRFIVEQTIGRHLAEIAETLLPEHGTRDDDGAIRWRNKTSAEADYWSAYLERLATLRILDPACGSGAFLIAAFNYLNAEQKRVRERLSEIRPGILTFAAPNADVEIITNNLFGVDLNAESVEITKLALWLQTARRDRALERLDGNIQHGNSLVNEEGYHTRPFDWDDRFAAIKAEGGFDIVIGNPPYVRMELVKPIKPHLQERFAVATDRADLYAYFFELGVEQLKVGGRLGFISSSTFFRTGSGKLLRGYLSAHGEIETVVDFGDLQVFEGVTTYPAIVTLRRGGEPDAGELDYLTVKALPDDLGKTFEQESRAMPRARLTEGTWRFESEQLDAIRAKMTAGRQTLADVYGAPLYGIKTGLNEAFVLTRAQRDGIVTQAARTPGDRSSAMLKPFLIGENLKRWHVESDDLWLVYTPKNQINIDDYPALRDYLLPYADRASARATKQEWWELQQAQAAYEDRFLAPKICYSDITNRGGFSVDRSSYYLANTAYFIPSDDDGLAAFLNSRLAWFFFSGLTNVARGGYLRLRTDFVEQVPLPAKEFSTLRSAGRRAADAAAASAELGVATLRRLADIDPRAVTIRDWPSLTFAHLQAMLTKRFKATIPVAQRDGWEAWYEGKRAEAAALAARIVEAEAEIDARVYGLFELTPTEIAAIEDALAVSSPTLGLAGYEAISAVEGLHLTEGARERLAAGRRKDASLAA